MSRRYKNIIDLADPPSTVLDTFPSLCPTSVFAMSRDIRRDFAKSVVPSVEKIQNAPKCSALKNTCMLTILWETLHGSAKNW